MRLIASSKYSPLKNSNSQLLWQCSELRDEKRPSDDFEGAASRFTAESHSPEMERVLESCARTGVRERVVLGVLMVSVNVERKLADVGGAGEQKENSVRPRR